jgi:polyisoprenoid-binding protein YceI
MTAPTFRPLLAALLVASAVGLGGTAQAQTYNVETGNSRVYAKVDSATRFGHVHGVEGRLAACKLTLGGTGELIFDMTTFTADTAQARQYVGLDAKFSSSDAAKVTANMRGSAVLDVAQFPQAVFKVTVSRPLDGQAAGDAGRYQFDGQFTLHGTAKEMGFIGKVDKTDQEGVLRLTGSFTVLQTEYGIQPFSALGGLARVADQLGIWGDLVLTPAK